MIYSTDYGARWNLRSPTDMPKAAGTLCNRHLRIDAGCRGYLATRATESHAAQGLGRFVYLKDEATGELYSAPYEPVRKEPEQFNFCVGLNEITWDSVFDGLDVRLQLSLPEDDAVELWQVTVANRATVARSISVYPCFLLAQLSEQHRSAEYRPDLEGIVASFAVADTAPEPLAGEFLEGSYRQVKSFVLHERPPVAWQVRRALFEGEGGLHNPDALRAEELGCDDARQYDVPLAALQYRLQLPPGGEDTLRFMVGDATDKRHIRRLRDRYLSAAGFARVQSMQQIDCDARANTLQIDTPDDSLNHFVNHWLPRQLASANGADDDDLQWRIALVYSHPARARGEFLAALQRRPGKKDNATGALYRPPNSGIGWVLFLRAYLAESADTALLRETMVGTDGVAISVFERVNNAMHDLLGRLDRHGLLHTTQPGAGGACANESLSAAYALELWATICERDIRLLSVAGQYREGAEALRQAVNQHLWDGRWYARGITRYGATYGVSDDREGKIFLAPQSWALLAQQQDAHRRRLLLDAVDSQLVTTDGVMNLAPAFSQVRDDLSHISRSHPGLGENGSIHSLTAAHYAYSLYSAAEPERAFQVLRALIPGPDGERYRQRGQLPTFMPDAASGGGESFATRAGYSSGVASAAAASWTYLALIEGLLGVKGDREGLWINPQLPAHWPYARMVKKFRGATLYIAITRDVSVQGTSMSIDGVAQTESRIRNPEPGKRYQIELRVGRQARDYGAPNLAFAKRQTPGLLRVAGQ